MVDMWKNIGKPLIPMVDMWKTIDNNGLPENKTIEKPLTTMDFWQKTIAIPSCSKIYHRRGLYDA